MRSASVMAEPVLSIWNGSAAAAVVAGRPRASSWQRLPQLIASIEERDFRDRTRRDQGNGAVGNGDMAGKAARVCGRAERERARYNGAFGESDIEGKAAMGSGERAGKRMSFKLAGAHESMRAANEFQTERYGLTRMECQKFSSACPRRQAKNSKFRCDLLFANSG
jgi:hypothetical protein